MGEQTIAVVSMRSLGRMGVKYVAADLRRRGRRVEVRGKRGSDLVVDGRPMEVKTRVHSIEIGWVTITAAQRRAIMRGGQLAYLQLRQRPQSEHDSLDVKKLRYFDRHSIREMEPASYRAYLMPGGNWGLTKQDAVQQLWRSFPGSCTWVPQNRRRNCAARK